MKIPESKIKFFILFLFFNSFIYGHEGKVERFTYDGKTFEVERINIGTLSYRRFLNFEKFRDFSRLEHYSNRQIQSAKLSDRYTKFDQGKELLPVQHLFLNPSDTEEDILKLIRMSIIQYGCHSNQARCLLNGDKRYNGSPHGPIAVCATCLFQSGILVTPPHIRLENIARANWRQIAIAGEAIDRFEVREGTYLEPNPHGVEVCKRALLTFPASPMLPACREAVEMLYACRIATALQLNLSRNCTNDYLLPYLGNASYFLQRFSKENPEEGVYRPYSEKRLLLSNQGPVQHVRSIDSALKFDVARVPDQSLPSNPGNSQNRLCIVS